MKVNKLIEKLLTLPQNAEVAVHCGEDSSKVLDVRLIRRPPRIRSLCAILKELGAKDPLNCEDKGLLKKAYKINHEEIDARCKWGQENREFEEPGCQGDDFFELYGHYKNDKVTEAVCIIGEDF